MWDSFAVLLFPRCYHCIAVIFSDESDFSSVCLFDVPGTNSRSLNSWERCCLRFVLLSQFQGTERDEMEISRKRTIFKKKEPFCRDHSTIWWSISKHCLTRRPSRSKVSNLVEREPSPTEYKTCCLLLSFI